MPLLRYLFNWIKISIVKTVFKKGDRFNISLLTSFSEVFEKVTHARLHQHINQNNIHVNEHYGFRSNSSTENDSYKLINEIY
jgi:DNA-binding transcriptional regulator GbsR (MarR family)